MVECHFCSLVFSYLKRVLGENRGCGVLPPVDARQEGMVVNLFRVFLIPEGERKGMLYRGLGEEM